MAYEESIKPPHILPTCGKTYAPANRLQTWFVKRRLTFILFAVTERFKPAAFRALMMRVSVVLVMVAAANVAFAASKTWTGAVSINWNLAGNWTGGLPVTDDDILIPGSLTNYPVISAASTFNPKTISINSSGSGASLTINTGGALTAIGIITVNLNGTFTVNDGTATLAGITTSGTTNVNGGTITSSVNVILNAGTFNQSGGTVWMAVNTSTNPTDNLVINGGTYTQSGGTFYTKDYNSTSGTYNQTGSSALFRIFHDWKPTSGNTFNSTAGTVRFSGAPGGGATFISTNTQFCNILVDAGINPGFSADPTSIVRISGDFTNNNTSLANTTNATFTFNGSGAQNIIGTSTSNTFGHLVVDKSGGTVTMANAISIAGDFTMTAGTFDPLNYLLNISVNFTSFTGGTIKVGASTFTGNYSKNPTPSLGTTINYYRTGAQTVNASFQYSNLSLSGSGNKTFADAIIINNNLALSGTAVAILPDNTTSYSSTLKFENVYQVAGTYGGTISPATYKIGQWFGTTTTGILNNQAGCIGLWEGTANTNWHDPLNWCSAFIPDLATDVTIPSIAPFQPVISASAECASISLGSGTTNAILTISGTNVLTVAGNITFGGTGTKTLAFTSAGTLYIGGNLNAGGTFIASTGTVVFNGTGDQNLASYPYYNLTINKSAGTANLLAATTTTGLLSMTSGTLNMANCDLTVGSLTGSGNLTHSSGTPDAKVLTIGSDDTSPLAYSGIISDGTATSVSVIKTGTVAGSTGKLILSSANTYTGITTVSKGILNIQNADALGSISRGTTVIDGASLQLEGNIDYAPEPLILAGGGTTTIPGALRNESGENTWTGPITLTGSSDARIESNATSGGGALYITGTVSLVKTQLYIDGDDDTFISGIISGTGSGTSPNFNSIRKGGNTGILTLSGANTYTGQTKIQAGTLSVSSLNSIGIGHQLSSNLGAPTTTVNGTIQIGFLGTSTVFCILSYTGTGETTDRVVDLISPTGTTNCVIDNSGSGALIFSSNFTGSTGNFPGTLTLKGFNNDNNRINGILPNINGRALSLVKDGPGTWILGRANTYTGGTTIKGGILALGATGVLPDVSPLNLNGGTFSSGVTIGFNETLGTIMLSNNSMISLGSGVHSLHFAVSNAIPWIPGSILTIVGWAGGYDGTGGTAGRIYVGNSGTGLTVDQLAHIRFLNGGIYFPAKMLTTGEVVPYAGGIITTGNISGSPFCAGESGVSVPFTYSPPSLFPIGVTTFTAQLSNASGSFASPVNLQSVPSNATGSQSISITIPPLTPSGTGYRIRVVCDEPIAVVSDNGTNLTVVLPTITGNLVVFVGNSTQLTGSGTPAPINPWLSASPGVATVSNTGLVTGVSAGTSIITYTDNNGCTATATVTVLATVNFTSGAYIIDMGRPIQTIANGLKPYGLVYALIDTNVAVDWAINPLKSKDSMDFTLPVVEGSPPPDWSGKDYRGGSFIIAAESITQSVQDLISEWVDLGVVVDGPITTSFFAPVYKTLTIWPVAFLDAQNDGLITPYYSNAGVPTSSYVINANPGMLPPCGSPPGSLDLYVLPHADPNNWTPTWIANLQNFITIGGSIWAGCHAVSVLENLPGCNFLSNAGLVPFGSHANGSPPYTYNSLNLIEGDPVMQFIGTLDGATKNGSEQIYVPGTGGWRASTKLAVYDNTYSSGGITYTYPNAAAIVAYGHAFGDPTKGMIMYEAGHSLNNGSIAERVAAQRAYFNFLLTTGAETQFTITPPSIANQSTTICSGITFTFTPAGAPANVTYTWTPPAGTGFTGGAGQTTPQPSITGSLTNITASPVTASYTVTPAIGGCIGNAFTLTVIVNPAALIPDQTSTICSGGTFSVVPVNDDPPGTIVPSGTTYSWPAPDISPVGAITGGSAQTGQSSISQTLVNVTSNPATATYSVLPISNTLGDDCLGAYFTVTVTVNPMPEATGDTICQGGSGSLTSSTVCTIIGSAGPQDAGNGASVTGVGNITWNNPGNAISILPAGAYATATLNTGLRTSYYLQTTNYGFSIPFNATINGITLTIGRFEDNTTNGVDVRDVGVNLLKNGIITVTNKADSLTDWPKTTVTPATYGNSTDLWGETWTPADINASNFGVSLYVKSANNRIASVDYMIVSVTYTVSGLNWYTVSSGGTSIGTGSPFNPVGVPDSGLPNTDTPGTWTYWAECSLYPDCRTATDFVINPAPVVTNSPTKSICSGTSTNITLTSSIPSSFSWTIGTITGGITGASAGSGGIIDQVLTNPGSLTPGSVEYLITPISISDPCMGATFTITVTVNPCDPAEITCPPDILNYPADIGQCSAILNSVQIGTPLVTPPDAVITWVRSDGLLLTDPFPVGTTTITWTATNFSGSVECDQAINVVDNQAPTFTSQDSVEFCVYQIFDATYDGQPEPDADIIPDRPDWYIIDGTAELDISDINDNCCAVNGMTINWTITFSNGYPSINGTGQPSLNGPITLWGTTDYTEVVHTITYVVTDCNGNSSDPIPRYITIKPRPNVIK